MTRIDSHRNALDAAIDSRLLETASAAIARTETPGVAVAMLVDGRMAFARGIGSRDLRGQQPLAPDASFYIYSVTKLLMAVITLRLVERGVVDLDVPVQSYLPTLPLDTPVTLRQLLTHTAGAPDYGGLPTYDAALRADPGTPWSADDFLAHTLQHGLEFAPGTGWNYSNIGFLIVRLAIEQGTGQPLRVEFERTFARSLGLRRTFVPVALADAGVLTPGFSSFFYDDGNLHDISRMYAPGWVSHGVVISTAVELARMVDAIFGGRMLSAGSMEALLTPTPVPAGYPPFRQPAYGLGTMVDASSPFGVVAGHGGSGPGYSIGAFHFTNVHGRSVTSVALANRDAGDVGLQLAFELVDVLAAHLAEQG